MGSVGFQFYPRSTQSYITQEFKSSKSFQFYPRSTWRGREDTWIGRRGLSILSKINSRQGQGFKSRFKNLSILSKINNGLFKRWTGPHWAVFQFYPRSTRVHGCRFGWSACRFQFYPRSTWWRHYIHDRQNWLYFQFYPRSTRELSMPTLQTHSLSFNSIQDQLKTYIL